MRTRQKKFHAVVKADSEEHIGIFTNWTICSKHVLHVSGARYKGTHTLQETIDILHLEGIDFPNIFHKGKVYTIQQEFSNLPIDPITPRLSSDHTVATPCIVPMTMPSLAPDDFETSVVEQAYNVAQWISDHDNVGNTNMHETIFTSGPRQPALGLMEGNPSSAQETIQILDNLMK